MVKNREGNPRPFEISMGSVIDGEKTQVAPLALM